VDNCVDENRLLLRDFARHCRSRSLSPKTIKNYVDSAQCLAGHHAGKSLLEMTRGDIEDYLVSVLDARTASTAATRFRCLQQFYKWVVVVEELAERSPMTGLTAPAIPEKAPGVLSDEEIGRLLKVAEGRGFTERRDTAIIRLMLEPGGMRLGEVSGLAVDDVDLDRDLAHVMGKGRRARAIPFGDHTGQALTRYLRERQRHAQAASPWLWLGAKGPLTSSGVDQAIRRRAAAAGLPWLHPHALRHTAAHRWKSRGASDDDTMRLFGWRSMEMVQRYGAKLADDRAQAAARRLRLGDDY
jgi:site-specific recombinase XerD